LEFTTSASECTHLLNKSLFLAQILNNGKWVNLDINCSLGEDEHFYFQLNESQIIKNTTLNRLVSTYRILYPGDEFIYSVTSDPVYVNLTDSIYDTFYLKNYTIDWISSNITLFLGTKWDAISHSSFTFLQTIRPGIYAIINQYKVQFNCTYEVIDSVLAIHICPLSSIPDLSVEKGIYLNLSLSFYLFDLEFQTLDLMIILPRNLPIGSPSIIFIIPISGIPIIAIVISKVIKNRKESILNLAEISLF
jgi:hypothetical protein